MTKFVLDASAVTAVLRAEPGAENVIPHLPGSLISSVNMAEVYCTVRSIGSDPEQDQLLLQNMQLVHVPFCDKQAQILSSIYLVTKGSTVGIADRACMSLAMMHELPILTGDRAWISHNTGLDIVLFRHGDTA